MKDRIVNYIRAGFPALALQTVEESRAMEVVLAAAKTAKRNVFAWTTTEGIRQLHKDEDNDWNGYSGINKSGEVEETQMLGEAARKTIAALSSDNKAKHHYGLLVLCDVHTWAQNLDPMAERQIKDLLTLAPSQGMMVVFLGPDFSLPSSWEKFITVLDFSLPNREELNDILTKIEQAAKTNKIDLEALTNGEREDVLRAASGLTAPEAENAFSLAIIEGREDRKINAKTVYREKVATIRKSGLMDIIEPDPRGLDAIGGMDLLKKWILQRKRCYSKEAREYGLPSPKGCLLVGNPGGGKSLAARCIATAMNVPLVRWDIGTSMAGIVGETEARTRAALALANAVAPCVLNIEEIEKAMAGSTSSGDLDSGVGRRLLGYLLTWLQEGRKDVFVVATANQAWHLPPELIRAGRFDAIWMVRLPKDEERKEIFRIHLEKRNRNPKKFDVSKLAEASKDFTGSECEEAIVSGMYKAFETGKEVSTAYIVEACKETVPLVKTMPEDIHRIEEWGSKRARPASSEEHGKGEQFRQLMGG